jgi:uncharacterized Zn finger protein (UPF0148 family)
MSKENRPRRPEPLIKTCPVCGFTFKKYKKEKGKLKCPMCGHEFKLPHMPNEPDNFKKRTF